MYLLQGTYCALGHDAFDRAKYWKAREPGVLPNETAPSASSTMATSTPAASAVRASKLDRESLKKPAMLYGRCDLSSDPYHSLPPILSSNITLFSLFLSRDVSVVKPQRNH